MPLAISLYCQWYNQSSSSNTTRFNSCQIFSDYLWGMGIECTISDWISWKMLVHWPCVVVDRGRGEAVATYVEEADRGGEASLQPALLLPKISGANLPQVHTFDSVNYMAPEKNCSSSLILMCWNWEWRHILPIGRFCFGQISMLKLARDFILI